MTILYVDLYLKESWTIWAVNGTILKKKKRLRMQIQVVSMRSLGWKFM